MTELLRIVTLSTRNIARSVMLGHMVTTLADAEGVDWHVRTAGTHVSNGATMIGHARDALRGLDDLGEHHFGAHRSHQLTDDDVDWADIVVAVEADHVRFVRDRFNGAAKTVQLHQFVRFAPLDATFDEQLDVVTHLEPSAEYDIADPSGGSQVDYDVCARDLWELAQVFALLVTGTELD